MHIAIIIPSKINTYISPLHPIFLMVLGKMETTNHTWIKRQNNTVLSKGISLPLTQRQGLHWLNGLLYSIQLYNTRNVSCYPFNHTELIYLSVFSFQTDIYYLLKTGEVIVLIIVTIC